jgi:hypothetical protein
LDAFPADLLDLAGIPGMRRKWAGLRSQLPVPVIDGVSSEDYLVPGFPGDPDVMVRVWPAQAPGRTDSQAGSAGTRPGVKGY